MEIIIPATVPPDKRETYRKHYATITKETGRLLLFAADQKMEHLNADFHGPDLAPEINSPEHVFKIAAQSKIGVFAAHLGLISRNGSLYPTVNYLPKLDGKTNLGTGEPYSQQIWTVNDAVTVAQNANINICGVGYTVYVGSEHEREMLLEAATIVKNAHGQGLLAILWMYPRGSSVTNQLDENVIAGAAGVGASLGADFVKINEPGSGPASLKQAVQAAGNTKVLVSGGKAIDPKECIAKVKAQLETGHVAGAAVGRNIFQHPLKEAVAIADQLATLVYG